MTNLELLLTATLQVLDLKKIPKVHSMHSTVNSKGDVCLKR